MKFQDEYFFRPIKMQKYVLFMGLNGLFVNLMVFKSGMFFFKLQWSFLYLSFKILNKV